MSEVSNNGDGPRATVALVSAQIGEVKALIEGHKALTAEGFVNVQRQLDAVAKTPERVARLEERVRDLESDSTWRRVNLPALLLAGASLVVAAVALFL